jgi:hypothetical protein
VPTQRGRPTLNGSVGPQILFFLTIIRFYFSGGISHRMLDCDHALLLSHLIAAATHRDLVGRRRHPGRRAVLFRSDRQVVVHGR